MPQATVEPQLIERALDGIAPQMIAFRRDIHAHPELAWNEVRTSAAVAGRLRQAGLVPSMLSGGTGLVCEVPGRGAGPRVALRADLDALPLVDEKDVGLPLPPARRGPRLRA